MGEERIGGGVVAPEFAGLGHLPFLDSVDCKVEPKTGRMTLPSHLRPAFTDGSATLRLMKSGSVWVFTPLGFVRFQKAVERTRPAGMVGPRSRARTFASGKHLPIDRQGRFVLSPPVREHLGVATDVVVAGCGDHIEMWHPERWYATEATEFDEWDLEAENFGGLDLETGE
jgi:MraZ protein